MKSRETLGLFSHTIKSIVRFVFIKLHSLIQFAVFDVLFPAIRWLVSRAVKRVYRQQKKYRRWWRITKRSYRFYIAGHVIMLIWFFLFTVTREASWLLALLCIGATMYFLGFVIWTRPIMQKIFVSPWAKWAFRVMHGFFLIFAIVVARNVVADALKMPPQYFDVTVAFVALIAYVPVYVGACAFFLLVLFIGTFVLWGIGMLVQQVVHALFNPLLGRPKWLSRATGRLEMRSNKIFFHAIGIMVMGFILATLLDGFTTITRYASPGIRWFAYLADFQPAGQYPGVSCEGRIRLQDNGIVSVARIINKDVVFKSEIYKPAAENLRGCTPAS